MLPQNGKARLSLQAAVLYLMNLCLLYLSNDEKFHLLLLDNHLNYQKTDIGTNGPVIILLLELFLLDLLEGHTDVARHRLMGF